MQFVTRIHWKPALFLLIAIILTAFILTLPDAEAGNCISASMTETDFQVDNSDGLASDSFEPDLTIRNECGSPTNITISFTNPDGEDTDKTKEIYPHIFSDDRRRKDKGMTYSVQVEEGVTHFYPLIEVNFSTFADEYTFECRVTNDDNGESIEPIDFNIEVTQYNDIKIKLLSKEDKEKSVRQGGKTEYYFELTNEGNIWREEVYLDVENDYPSNISIYDIELPPNQNFVNPTFHELDSTIIIAMKVEVQEDAGDLTYSFLISPDTLTNEPNNHGHPSVEVKLIVLELSPPPTKQNVTVDDPQPITALLAGGIGSISMLMFGVYYFTFQKNKDDDTIGWGSESSWEADEWGSEEAVQQYESPEDFEAPITGPPDSSPSIATEGSFREPSLIAPSPPTVPSKPQTITPTPTPPIAVRVTCPKCAIKIKVSNPKRPLNIGCPKCSTKFKLKGKPSGHSHSPDGGKTTNQQAPPRSPSSLVKVKCPKCATGMKISNPKRPLTIGCPKCQVKFTLKGKTDGQPGNSKGSPASQKTNTAGQQSKAPAHHAVTRISCPKCSVKIKVSNPKRPLKVACPKCKTGLHLKG